MTTIFLKSLIKSAEDFLGKKVQGAVITVPSWFEQTQKDALEKAANDAGITVLQLLEEAGAHGVVYLDADTLVTRNFDELFALPYALAAAPDVYTNRKGFWFHFNAGVLFVRPSAKAFRQLVSQIDTAQYPHWEAEQAFLNVFFGAEAVGLPYIYNGNMAIKRRNPALWEGMQSE